MKWYWFLNLEVLLAILFGIMIVTVLILPHSLNLLLLGFVMTAAASKARSYRQRICEKTGPEVRPPKSFVLFWWIVVALEAVWLTVRMIQGMTG